MILDSNGSYWFIATYPTYLCKKALFVQSICHMPQFVWRAGSHFTRGLLILLHPRRSTLPIFPAPNAAPPTPICPAAGCLQGGPMGTKAADSDAGVTAAVEHSPEKAGVGGSIPSLATTESATYRPCHLLFGSNWFQFGSQRCVSNTGQPVQSTQREKREKSEERGFDETGRSVSTREHL